ncbi:hypothetical protein E2A64_10345 [Pseudohoeflea suaedae]|uniref:Uncharacterized protein n=1 Tax=Pseudohoeflea suaedae TaxID=877384 RepID=A0A4R5PJ93_9HYPH|nr:hypothetical protein [Pseudohoeflea suaedae]TDH35727.1 hypothetical protein E2A64_10345 [Pseudohoeflea suaedae]
MAITFPRAIPDVGYSRVDVALNEQVKAARTGSGTSERSEIGDPFWTVDLETKPLRMAEKDAVEAWAMSLRGGLKYVLFSNPHRCRPKNHQADPTPAEDTGLISSVSGGNVLTVASVSAALNLAPGDMIGLLNTHYHWSRVTEYSIASTTATITVEPPPPSDLAVSGTVVSFISPPLLMRLVPGSFKVSGTGLFRCSFSLEESR